MNCFGNRSLLSTLKRPAIRIIKTQHFVEITIKENLGSNAFIIRIEVLDILFLTFPHVNSVPFEICI